MDDIKKLYFDFKNRCDKVSNLKFVKDENDNFYLSDGITRFSDSYPLDLYIKMFCYCHEASLESMQIDFFESKFLEFLEAIPDNEINDNMLSKDLIENIEKKYYLSNLQSEALFNYYLKEKQYKKLFTFSKMEYQNKILEVLTPNEISSTLDSIIEEIKEKNVIGRYTNSIFLLKKVISKNDFEFINKYYDYASNPYLSSLLKDIELPEEIIKEIENKDQISSVFRKNKSLFNYLKEKDSDLVRKFNMEVFDLDEFSYELCTNYHFYDSNDELTEYFVKTKGIDCLINLNYEWATDNFVMNHFNELDNLLKKVIINSSSEQDFSLGPTPKKNTIKKLFNNNYFSVNFIKNNKEELSKYIDKNTLQNFLDKDNLSVEEYNEIYDIIVENYFNLDYYNTTISTKLLVCALERNDIENLVHFFNFDSELIYPYYEKLKDNFSKEIRGLRSSSKFFEYCIINNYYDIVEQLELTDKHEKYIINNLDLILSKYDASNLPSIFHSSYTVLEYIIANGYTDLIESYDEKAMRNLFKLKLPEYDIDDKYDKPYDEFEDILDKIGNLGDKSKKNDIKFLNQFIKTLDEKNDSCIFYEMRNSNRLRKYLFDNKRYDLFIQFPFYNEKEIENYKKHPAVIQNFFGLTLEEFTNKMDKLYSKNTELLKTMLPFMLTKKFECFNEACLSRICLYPDLQLKLKKLDDHTVNVLAHVYEKLVSNTELDYSGVFIKAINNVGMYKTIIDNISEDNFNNVLFTENLIKVLSDSENIYSVKSLDDVLNLNNKENLYFENINSKINSNTINLDELKTAILMKKFGINGIDAKFLIDRYCFNIDEYEDNDFENNETMKSIITILKAINNIYSIEDIDKLKDLYTSDNKRIKVDYKYSLEAFIRSEYAKVYSDSLYKVNEEHSVNKENIKNQEIYNLINNSEYNGIHPKFYMMDGNFNLQVHALGAYREWTRPENFKDDWYRPFIAYHGICTSYVGNEQIATARASHPVYGFANYESSAYLCSGNYDLFSDDVISKFDSGYRKAYNMLLPEQMIDNTRHTHNEIVIERTIAGKDEIVKRGPDYVVLFVDDVNNKYNFKKVDEVLLELYQKYPDKKDLIKEKYSVYNNVLYDIGHTLENDLLTEEDLYKLQLANIYEETLQASVDQNIPIVIVDRLKYAKKEKDECNKMFEEFKNNLKGEINIDNGNELYKLLLKVFNNMVGCYNYSKVPLEYANIFSIEEFDKLFKNINNAINEIPDSKSRFDMYDYLWLILDNENDKREYTRTYCQLGDLSAEIVDTVRTLDKTAFEILKEYTLNELKKVDNQADRIIDSIHNVIDLLKIVVDYNIDFSKIEEDYGYHIWRLLKNEFEDEDLLMKYRENKCPILEFYKNFVYNDDYVNMEENNKTNVIY